MTVKQYKLQSPPRAKIAIITIIILFLLIITVTVIFTNIRNHYWRRGDCGSQMLPLRDVLKTRLLLVNVLSPVLPEQSFLFFCFFYREEFLWQRPRNSSVPAYINFPLYGD